MNCISCKHQHNTKFCPNCGESAELKKLTIRSILSGTFSSITNMDKGFLYNLKHLTLNTQKLVLGYIHGKRKGVFNPFSFLLLTITIYLIAISFAEPVVSTVSSTKSQAFLLGKKIGVAAKEFINLHFKYFWILSILWLGLATRSIFGRFNYAEHLTISSFIIGYATLVGLLGFYTLNSVLMFNPLLYLTIWWMLYAIFKQNSFFKSFLSALAATILFFIQLFLLVVAVGTYMSFS